MATKTLANCKWNKLTTHYTLRKEQKRSKCDEDDKRIGLVCVELAHIVIRHVSLDLYIDMYIVHKAHINIIYRRVTMKEWEIIVGYRREKKMIPFGCMHIFSLYLLKFQLLFICLLLTFNMSVRIRVGRKVDIRKMTQPNEYCLRNKQPRKYKHTRRV